MGYDLLDNLKSGLILNLYDCLIDTSPISEVGIVEFVWAIIQYRLAHQITQG